MRRCTALLMVVALLLAACAGGGKESKSRAPLFTNPVYAGTTDKLPEAPDPGAIKYNGEYFTYVTGDPCQVLRSDDMVHWTLVGPMIAERDNCWAPSVVYKNGTFYAYLSTVQAGTGDEKSRRVKLYTSNSPTGPFTYKATVTSNYSYDADYFADDDGQEYLYWTEECYTLPFRCGGNAVVVDKLVSMEKLAGQLARVAEAEGWECRNRCIFEAPEVLKRDGLYHMLYSAAAYENESYGSGYVRSPVPLGSGGVADHSWSRVAQLLKSVEVKVDGPGGGAWIKAPNNLDDWVIYHGRGFTKTTLGRWLRIDPVLWGKDRFWMPGAPSYVEQRGPAQPQFRDLFNRPDQNGLGKGWDVKGGSWSVKDGQARQAGAEGKARALVGPEAVQYVFEANIKGAGGVYAFYDDDRNWVTARLDPQARVLLYEAVMSGGLQGTETSPLPADTNFDVYHQLIIRRDSERFAVYLDGQLLRTLAIPYSGPARPGLLTSGAAAAFDGVSLTHGWEDFFDADSAAGWGRAEAGTQRTGGWSVTDGALTGAGRIFKGTRQWGSYEFTASVRQVSGGKYGLYAAYFDEKNHAEVLIDPERRVLTTQATVGGKPETPKETPLPEGFAANEFHTITVHKEGEQFRFFLDGAPVQEQTFRLAHGQPALLTETATAQYDSIRAVRWD